MRGEPVARNGRATVERDGAEGAFPLPGGETARYRRLSELLDRPVRLENGATVGKLQDLVFRDDPKYAEITHLLVHRPFGRPSWKVPWASVTQLEARGITLRSDGTTPFPDFEPVAGELLLRDQVLDKRVLDRRGSALSVVYDLQLLEAERKLFVVAAEVGRSARRRRSALFRLGPGPSPDGSSSEDPIPWKFVQSIGPDVTSTRGDVRLTVPRENLGRVRPEDLADILEELSREQRISVFNTLSNESAARALEETDPRVQREILRDADVARIERIFSHLSPVALSEILSGLPRDESEELLGVLAPEPRQKVRDLMDQHDVPASTLALPSFLAFPGSLTVEEAFARFRKEAPQSRVTMYLYIVDEAQRLEGVVDINELLQAEPGRRLDEIMTRSLVTISPETDLTRIMELFGRYRFRALPVVGVGRRIVGVVREKDAYSLARGSEFSGRFT
jgi:magnesium transporter